MLMYRITKQLTNGSKCHWVNRIKDLKSIAGFAMVMLFVFATNSLQAQGKIINNETAIIADFGIDGGAYDSLLEFGPPFFNVPPDAPPSAAAALGSDDWFNDLPNGNTADGAGVIDITSAVALAEIAKISAGQNATAELRMNAANNTTPEGDGREWTDAVYGRDHNVAMGNKDKTVFSQTVNKNYDDPRSWAFKEGDVPQKNDIIDVYAHLRKDFPSGEEYVMVGASTADADGSNHVDFEFFRKLIALDSNGNIVYVNAGDGEDCGHTTYEFDYDPATDTSPGGLGLILQNGDVLLSVDY
jgi:hypothetical protein